MAIEAPTPTSPVELESAQDLAESLLVVSVATLIAPPASTVTLSPIEAVVEAIEIPTAREPATLTSMEEAPEMASAVSLSRKAGSVFSLEVAVTSMLEACTTWLPSAMEALVAPVMMPSPRPIPTPTWLVPLTDLPLPNAAISVALVALTVIRLAISTVTPARVALTTSCAAATPTAAATSTFSPFLVPFW